MHHLETLIAAIPPAVFAGLSLPAPSGSGIQLQQPQKVPLTPIPSSPTAPGFSVVSDSHAFPPAAPHPSLSSITLTNPSAHFPSPDTLASPNSTLKSLFGAPGMTQHTLVNATAMGEDMLVEQTAKMSLSDSYLYFDDEGYTRWQGETSGLPLLDLLVERHSTSKRSGVGEGSENTTSGSGLKTEPMSASEEPEAPDWFPDRTLNKADVNPETLWRLITSYIEPELMDSLVQTYLSTSSYILPFLHVPTFLADYGNPQKWGEPGFAAFIVSICCLASRHTNDPRVRLDPSDGISAGTQWFELLGRLRTLPIADRPTLYTIQAALIAGVYAVGLGKLSKAAALLSEAVTISIDAGLHRSADTYDLFDTLENEVRKRTFWCVYIWDKQLAAHFGRPPMIRMKDCDVEEPNPVDDEWITREGVSRPPEGVECRLAAFVLLLRIMVVLESVLDVSPSRHSSQDNNSFLARVSSRHRGGAMNMMHEELALLDEIHGSVPKVWAHSQETLGCGDPIRVTQAERLHCAEMWVRMLVWRHRFAEVVASASPSAGADGGSNGDRKSVV